jgi:anti-sigma regulatory factor (Ser/Thr protein kinase)
MKSMDDVMKTSEQVMQFCSDKGADKRTAYMFSLFVEEMAANIVSHGFTKGRGGSIDLRLIYRDDSKVIRMRDDSLPFDPVSWLDKNSTDDPSRAMGIRMVVKLARKVTYMNSMEMNNLIIQI